MFDLSTGGGYLLTVTLSVGIGATLLLWQYAQREVSWHVFITTWLGVVLSMILIILIPYDFTIALAIEEQHSPESNFASVGWETIYWVSFGLCWIACPVLIDYESSGGFTVGKRIASSLRRNGGWFFFYAVTLLIVILWLSIDGRIGISAWCMAASNAWGLFLLTVLMGHGLVAVPQHFWRQANPKAQLEILYCNAVAIDEARLSTQLELRDLILESRLEVRNRATQTVDPDLEEAFKQLQMTLEESELLHCELTNGARGHETGQSCTGSRPVSVEEPTKVETLAEICHSLRSLAQEARRASCRWQMTVYKCLTLEDLEEQLYPSAVEASAQWEGSIFYGCCRQPAMRAIWWNFSLAWMKCLRTITMRFLAAFTAWLSGTILLSQVTIVSKPEELSFLPKLVRGWHGFWLNQVFVLVPLVYLLCTCYWSVFRMKIAGWYGLYPDHNTDTPSLLWCSAMLARLAPALSFQYLQLIQAKGTGYQAFMDQMFVVPVLGTSFNEAFPYAVALVSLANLLNLWPRVASMLQLEVLQIDSMPLTRSGASDEIREEGRRLIERERRKRSEDRNLLEMTDQNRLEEGRVSIPLRFQIQALIEDGTLPLDWNAASPP